MRRIENVYSEMQPLQDSFSNSSLLFASVEIIPATAFPEDGNWGVRRNSHFAGNNSERSFLI